MVASCIRSAQARSAQHQPGGGQQVARSDRPGPGVRRPEGSDGTPVSLPIPCRTVAAASALSGPPPTSRIPPKSPGPAVHPAFSTPLTKVLAAGSESSRTHPGSGRGDGRVGRGGGHRRHRDRGDEDRGRPVLDRGQHREHPAAAPDRRRPGQHGAAGMAVGDRPGVAGQQRLRGVAQRDHDRRPRARGGLLQHVQPDTEHEQVQAELAGDMPGQQPAQPPDLSAVRREAGDRADGRARSSTVTSTMTARGRVLGHR